MTEKNLNEPLSKVPEIKEKKLKSLAPAITEKSKEEDKKENKKEEKTEKKKTTPKVKKIEATVYGKSLPISLKQSMAIGKFVKYKKIDESIKNLELVLKKKLAVPFKGEIPHRKRSHMLIKSMPSGRYPENASKQFIILLKTLSANCNVNGMGLERTIISDVIVNKAPSQKHRFGNTEFKRSHVFIRAKEVPEKKEKKEVNKK